MLEKVLQSILRRYFGQFISGVENVELAFWTGKINIQSASFRHQKINELFKVHHVPLSIQFSYIGGLELDIPWNKLSSAPVEIKLSDVYLVFSLDQFVDRISEDKLDQNAKYLLIKKYVEYILKKSEEMGQTPSEGGFLKKMLVKILHNVNLQIGNIHIRVETGRSQGRMEEDDLYYSCFGEDNKPTDFSLGFCIQKIEADTINERNEREYVQIESEKTVVRKNINLRQISVYWEEDTVAHFGGAGLAIERKIERLKEIIGRWEHRMLTLDGTLLMEKNRQNLDYFFSTSFRILEMRTNYQQMKQLIQVTQAFINSRKKKKLAKIRQLKHEAQLKQEPTFKKHFQKLYLSKFQRVSDEFIRLIQSVNHKLLMRWTRSCTIELMTRDKIKVVRENKNKRSWLSLLSKKAEIDLSEEEIREIEREIMEFIEMAESGSQVNAGLYLFIKSVTVLVDHPKLKQKLSFAADQIQIQLERQDRAVKVDLRVLDVGLTYEDLKKDSEVSIFRKNSDGGQKTKLIELEMLDTRQEQKLHLYIQSLRITHEIQFLGFISEMINLQQKEQVKANAILNSQPINKRTQSFHIPSTDPTEKIYNYNIEVKTIEVKIELDPHTQLHAYLEGITARQDHREHNQHTARINNFGVVYIDNKNIDKTYNIIEDINIRIYLTGLKKMQGEVDSIKIVLNEESLYSIGSCFQSQLKLLKIRKKEYKTEWAEAEQKYMEGETQIISLFKSIKVYHTVLLEDRLVFYEKSYDNRIDYSQKSKEILLQNLGIARHDELSFKLESISIDQIIYCKNKGDTDRWMYLIEERILENSNNRKIFSMIEEQEEEKTDQPHIYIPYDSTIDLRVARLEVVYSKNDKEKILSLIVLNIQILLKENNLLFERRIYIQELWLKNLMVDDRRDEYNTLVSNMLNYFEEPDSESEHEREPNIRVLIEGKKKTNPSYTGQLSIKAQINRLFVNFNAEFVYHILYRLVYGDKKAKAYPQTIRNTKIIQLLKEILEERLDIPKKYKNAQNFEFGHHFFQLQKYRQKYSCHVLFHVELKVEEVEVYLVNGRNYMWSHRVLVDRWGAAIDKGTDFIFLHFFANAVNLSDITGYPKTVHTPFCQQQPYPLVIIRPEKEKKAAVECRVGLFPPHTFVNKQNFKNYFFMRAQNIHINYQHQPLMRFIDFLTNQIILFFMEPFNLHKYDTPDRGSYTFDQLSFTQKDIKKMLYESVYPTFTHLHLQASNLTAVFNTFPNREGINIKIKDVNLESFPYVNNQRVHVRLDLLKDFSKQYRTLQEIQKSNQLESRVTKFQWATRYLIKAQSVSCDIFQNDFNFDMYFQRANNGDKDLLLPFMRINKDLVMEARIKYLNVKAQKPVYNLINKFFNFNLGYDDQYDILFNTNHEFQHLNKPSKIIFAVDIGQLAYLIPDVDQSVVVIPNCVYRFIREETLVKRMEISGKGIHVFGGNGRYNLMEPISISHKNGLEYSIEIEKNGDKMMTGVLNNVDFSYQLDYFMRLLRYFLVDQQCYPKMQQYGDIPWIKCEVQLKNSYYRIGQTSQFIYALKGDIDVIWSRPRNIHPQNYKKDKELYPVNSVGNLYDVTLKGVTLRKYEKHHYAQKEKNYRALSMPMHLKAKFSNVMKISGDVFYTDLVSEFDLEYVCLKLCYKDVAQLVDSFKKGDGQDGRMQERANVQPPPQPPPQQLGYIPQSKHNFSISKLSIQMGLSQLPVPLLSFTLQSSEGKMQILGQTKILTSKLQSTLQYWNMLIGRWQPVLQKSKIDELTLRLGKQTYCSVCSSHPLLINFSIEAIKIIKLISKDISEKGQFKTLSREGRIRGMHVSPYALTNRTGHSILIQNRSQGQFNRIETNKLKNNDTTHVSNKSPDLDQTLDTVKFQIEGDPNEHQVNFNMVESECRFISYQGKNQTLLFQVLSSPILKEVVISSCYVLHNKTGFDVNFRVEEEEFLVGAGRMRGLPFSINLQKQCLMGLEFPHLHYSRKSQKFTLSELQEPYEHITVYGDDQLFNCLITLTKEEKHVIAISPMTSFVNLLPLDLRLQVVYTKANEEKAIIEETLKVSSQKILYQFGSKNMVSLRIKFTGFNYSAFHDLNYEVEDNQGKMTFIDHRGIQSCVLTRAIIKDKQKTVYLYLDTVLVNQSHYPLFLYAQGQLLAGQRIKDIPQSQSKFTIVNNTRHLSLGFKVDDPSGNAKINSQQLGNQSLLVANNDKMYQLVLNSSVHCVEQKLQIFTKIMKITPQFIIQNRCTRQICLRQVNTEQKFMMGVGEVCDWIWSSKDDTRQLTFTVVDNQMQLRDGWDFSAPIEPQTLEEIVIVLRPNGRSEKKMLIKIEVFKENQFTYIIFKELNNPEDSLITFKNSMHLAELEIRQTFLDNISPPWHEFKHFNCYSNKQTPFGWDYPGEDHEVTVHFNFLQPYRSHYQCDQRVIDLDKLNKPQIYEFKSDEDQILEISVSVEYIGIQRVIIFMSLDETSTTQMYEEELELETTKNKIGVCLAEIGISLIGGRPRSQILYISVKKMELIIMQKLLKRNFQLKIKYINIDNNLHHNTIFPVLFTPLKQRKTIEKPRPFLICLVEQSLKSNKITQFNYFRMAIEPISFKLYDQIVSKVYDMTKEFNAPDEEQPMELYKTYRSYAQEFQWVEKQVSRDKSIFIRQVEIGKLIIELSFSIKPTSGGNIIIYTIVTLFRTALSNVSESQIKLSRFYKKNINLLQLVNEAGQFYRKQVFKEIYKIPTSINILGNPYVLVNYLAEGVWEIINQPAQGFIKGPIQGAVGVVKGGVFFTRNVIAGTFNSFQVISQSVSHGISYVTFDQKFITRRDKIQMQKSKHLWEGTKSATFALYTGFQVAITGLYRHPKENIEKSGAAGFFKGMAIGLAGLVTKPLSGIFEGISKFSQGIKQTALFFQDGPNTTRSRPPRVFIGQQQYFTEYNVEESKAVNLLQFHSTKYLNNIIILVSVDTDQNRGEVVYTVLTNQFLVMMSKVKKKIIHEIPIEEIGEVEIARAQELKINVGDENIIVYTHKYKEMYECFRVAFELLERNIQQQEQNK